MLPEYYADRVRLVLRDRKSGAETVLTEAWDRSAAGWAFAPDDGGIRLQAEDRGCHALFRLGFELYVGTAVAMPIALRIGMLVGTTAIGLGLVWNPRASDFFERPAERSLAAALAGPTPTSRSRRALRLRAWRC